MIEIRGKYNQAKIFTDVVDSASIAQVQELCNQEFTAQSRIRLMPDIHAGKGCTIGTTMTIADKVVPNLVGVDIGCGMETVRIRESRMELEKLDKLIYSRIPSGFSIRKRPTAIWTKSICPSCTARAMWTCCGQKRASALWAAATTSSRWTRTTKEICISWSIPAAAIWEWRWPATTRTRATGF